jgi:WD40 repeat protein
MRTLFAVVVVCFGCPAFAADPVKTDRYGDPLPPGAIMRLGTLRNRAPITGFGIEKDGTVVTVGPGADVRRWHSVDDKSDDPIQLPLKGAATSNEYPQVSPDGKLVAARSEEKVVVWEVPADAKAKPKEVAALDVARAQFSPHLYRFSPDGTKLLVAQHEPAAAVYLYDIKTGKRTDLDCAPAFVDGLTFSGDGKRVGVVGRLGVDRPDFYLLDAATGKQLAKHEVSGWVSALALNRAGDVLAVVDTSNSKNEFRFTDPLTGKKLDGLVAPEGPTLWITFAEDGKTVLVGGPYCVRWWDPAAGKLIRTFEGLASEPSSFSLRQRTPGLFSPDGLTLVAHNGSALLRWDAATGKPRFPEQDVGHGGAVTGIGTSPDGKRIVTRSWGGRVCVWDAATGKELSHAPASGHGSAHIDFSPDGKFVFVPDPEGEEATKIDTETGKVVTTFSPVPKGSPRLLLTVRLSKDGKTLYATVAQYTKGAPPSAVMEWDAVTGERKKVTPVSVPMVQLTDFSPDATTLAGGYPTPGVVALAESATNLKNPNINGFSIDPGRFSADGKWYALANNETKGLRVYVVSTKTWEVACTIPMDGHGRFALAPDGKVLALARGEKIEFYDTATARLLSSHPTPDAWGKWGGVSALQFTRDGTKLITGHADTTALVWPVPARPAK